MSNEDTKKYIIEKLNKAGIPLKVERTKAYKDKNFSKIINLTKKSSYIRR